MNAEANPMPLAELISQYGRARPQADLKTFVTQLQLLPNLRFLKDGLLRSRDCITAYAGEMAHCLMAIPGARLEPMALLDEINHLLVWINQQGWPENDPRLGVMARPTTLHANPLRSYCLTVNFHWPNLFYTQEPVLGAPAGGGSSAYEKLMAEFSAYVLAAQSMIEPDTYLSFCQEWWDSTVQPAQAPFPTRRLTSRVRAASRAMRHTSLIESTRLREALSDPSRGDSLNERVFNTLLAVPPQRRIEGKKRKEVDEEAAAKGNDGGFSDKERSDLEAIARLLEDVIPGWYRPGSSDSPGSAEGRTASNKERRLQYRDGYVRVSESLCVLASIETESGIEFQTTALRPPEIEEIEKQVLADLEESRLADVEDSGGKSDAREKKRKADIEREKLVKEAREEAAAEQDGLEWFPADYLVSADQIEAALLPASERAGGANQTPPAVSPGGASRWAADQLKRYHLANMLVPGRIDLVQAQAVLDAMRAENPQSPVAELFPALHASISLGRSLDEAVRLRVHKRGGDDVTADPETIHYILEDREWVIPAPPPAWASSTISPHERGHEPQIYLRDQTKFHSLLSHLGMARPGRPVKKLKDATRMALEAWIKKILPRTDVTLSSCSRFLFYRLLEVSRGDVGVASLITSQIHSHSRSVAHYTHYPEQTVKSIYRAAWGARLLKEHFAPESIQTSESESIKGYGARRVPTLKAVQDLIAWLQEQIGSTSGYMQHNLYTAYTWVGLVLGMGMRPVREPHVFKLGRGIAKLHVLTYLDKARSDYDRRVNALPPVVDEQLQRYARYLRVLDRLQPLTSAETLPALRFIDENGNSREFRPSDFTALVGAKFGLELYSLRRFARTHLIADPKLDGEDVDAWMGHWFSRVSPHDRLSTYPMMRLHGIAMNAASRMIKATKYRPLSIRR